MKKIAMLVFLTMVFSAFSTVLIGEEAKAERIYSESELQERIPNSGIFTFGEKGKSLEVGGEVIPPITGDGFISGAVNYLKGANPFRTDVLERVDFYIVSPEVSETNQRVILHEEITCVDNLNVGTSASFMSFENFDLSGIDENNIPFDQSLLGAGESLSPHAPKGTYHIIGLAYRQRAVNWDFYRSCEERGVRQSDWDISFPIVIVDEVPQFEHDITPYANGGKRLDIDFETKGLFANIEHFYSATQITTVEEFENTSSQLGLGVERQNFESTEEIKSQHRLEIEFEANLDTGYTYILAEDINGNKQLLQYEHETELMSDIDGVIHDPRSNGEGEGPDPNWARLVLFAIGGVLFISISLLVIQKVVDKRKYV